MSTESRLSRYLWATLLATVTIVLVLSVARHALSGSEDEASGFSSPLTLWVAGDSSAQMTTIAAQATSCWQLHGGTSTVGLLPGNSTLAVSDFLGGATGRAHDLLMITSTTISDIARDRRDPPGDESSERAGEAEMLLDRAAPVAVLATDPLALVVTATSPIRTGGQVLGLLRSPPPRPLFAVSTDSWLRGNLASLVARTDSTGELPYEVFPGSREALASLEAGASEVGVTTRSAVRDDLQTGRVREIPWPTAAGDGPRAWVAVLAPPGLPGAQIARLRAEATANCSGGAWSRLLRGEGLSPVTLDRHRSLSNLLRGSFSQAAQDQALAGRVIRDYG